MSVSFQLVLIVLFRTCQLQHNDISSFTNITENSTSSATTLRLNESEFYATDSRVGPDIIAALMNCSEEKVLIRKAGTNVHRLRPENIDLIAALGDSTIAGTEVSALNHGISFAAGGVGNISATLTLPNIIRIYNPNLSGYSTKIGSASMDTKSALNVAKPNARMKDLSTQAAKLLSRLRSSYRDELKWKLVTISVGTEDLCHYCFNRSSDQLVDWIKNLRNVIGYLKYNLRNVYINLIGLRNIEEFRKLVDTDNCSYAFEYRCPCIKDERYDEIFEIYNQALQNEAKLWDRFDFAVVYQPVWTKLENETSEESNVTISLLAADCFELSAVGQSLSASALWNNMLEDVGHKTKAMSTHSQRLLCPSKECPYFRTNINSIDCNATDHELKLLLERKPFISISDETQSALSTYFLFIIALLALTAMLVIAGLVVAATTGLRSHHSRRTGAVTERTRLIDNENYAL